MIIRSTRIVNSVVTPTIYNVGSMSYVGTFNSSAITYWNNQFFRNYRDMAGYVCLYEYSFPADIIASISDTFTITADLSLAFNDLEYIEFFCGFAFEQSYGRNISSNSYPNNYLSCSSTDSNFNGHVYPYALRPGLTNQSWGEFCWNFPGSIVGQQNTLQLCFVDNHISYNSVTTPVSIRLNSITANLPGTAYTRNNLNHFFFAIGGPVVSENGTVTEQPETVDDILAMTEEQKELLIQIQVALESEDSLVGKILAALQTLLNALNTGVIYDIDLTLHRIEAFLPTLGGGGGGGSGGLTSSDVESLFSLSKEDLLEIQTDWNHMFREYFPALYEAEETEKDIYSDLLESDYSNYSLHYSGFSVQDQQIIPPMDIPAKPAGSGWDAFFDTLAVAVNVVITFLFINGLRHRFDKSVLEDDA